MERLEPKKERSPISSLKFQRKSDYEKFLKFIKNQTKELKGISKPKENKVKSILGVAGTGLGIFAIGSLFLGSRRSDEFETAKGLDGGLDLYAAIGRRNVPGINPSRPTLAGYKLPYDLRQKQSINLGTRTSVTRGRSFAEERALRIKPGFAEKRAIKR